MSVLASPPRLESWQILAADQETADAQMAMDERLAREAQPVFRLFRWKQPAVSLGFKQRPPAWVDPAGLARHGLEVVERPTGGGIAVHGSDLSCSVVAPQSSGLSLQVLMERVCEALAQGVRELGAPVAWTHDVEQPSRITYCLTEPSPYALMVGRRKLCGLAIRRYQMSWLIQGSLLVRAVPAVFAQVMPPEVFEALAMQAISLEAAAGRAIAEGDVLASVVEAWRRTWKSPDAL